MTTRKPHRRIHASAGTMSTPFDPHEPSARSPGAFRGACARRSSHRNRRHRPIGLTSGCSGTVTGGSTGVVPCRWCPPRFLPEQYIADQPAAAWRDLLSRLSPVLRGLGSPRGLSGRSLMPLGGAPSWEPPRRSSARSTGGVKQIAETVFRPGRAAVFPTRPAWCKYPREGTLGPFGFIPPPRRARSQSTAWTGKTW